MNLNGENVLVYGIGESGKSAINLLLSENAKVFVFCDKDSNVSFTFASAFRVEQIYDITNVLNFKIDLCVVSPGIQILGNTNIDFLRQSGIEIISELELGFNFLKGDIIAVTGTNGKTTTVSLLKEMLLVKYNKVFLCGNIGLPVTAICKMTTYQSAVIIEVSSFMLECIKNFKPKIACILNITPDHITRHKTYKNYFKTKFNINNNLSNEDILILNENIKKQFKKLSKKYKKIIFKLKLIKKNFKELKNKYKIKYFNIKKQYKNNKLYIYNHKIINTKKCKLIGEKNYENILNNLLVCSSLGINLKSIKNVVYNFKPLNARIEKFAVINKVTFINDSKATNPDSTICALSAMKKPVILLLGGSDKGFSFDEILNCTDKIKKIIIFGAVGDRIAECCKKNNFTNFTQYKTLKEATESIFIHAQKNDIVLLSPANASFDEFSGYKERGEKFSQWVKSL